MTTQTKLWVLYRPEFNDYAIDLEPFDFGPLAIALRFATREEAEKYATPRVWVIWRL